MTAASADDLPEAASFAHAFHVYEVETDGADVRYYGEPLVDRDAVVEEVAPAFRPRGYRVTLRYETGEYVLVATERSPGVDGVPWTNVLLFLATVATTLLAGARWYGFPVTERPLAVFAAWPFAAAVLGVLAVHELGHYALSRYHGVEASLPYFIPVPTLLGTLGAVIRMNDNMPDRKALFDIGVAGPLAGLVATVVVTAVGVSLPPVAAPPVVARVELGYPPLVHLVAAAVGEPVRYADPSLMVNPVVVGGWVGAFVTFLNLLPVGQLDGAHVLRALAGDRATTVSRVVPFALFGLAGYLHLTGRTGSVGVWVVWGLLALLLSRVGGARPIDRSPVGPARWAVGLLAFALGLLAFTPTPIAVPL
ncbi:MAG: site-2 protease family protein [Haloferacaceae archaeon]